jgi:hypothetical protein
VGRVRAGLKMGRVSAGDAGNTLGLRWAGRPTAGPHTMGYWVAWSGKEGGGVLARPAWRESEDSTQGHRENRTTFLISKSFIICKPIQIQIKFDH